MAAGLIAAPLPALMQTAAAQTTQPEKKQVKTKKPPNGRRPRPPARSRRD
jgi:hypothetical protein